MQFTTLLMVFGLGCVGGITLDLIQFKGGLEMPNCYRKGEPVNGEAKKCFFDLGFVAELLIGGVAALVVFGLNPGETLLRLMAFSLLAGIGGGGLLLSFVNAALAKQAQAASKLYRAKLSDVLRMVKMVTKKPRSEPRSVRNLEIVYDQLTLIADSLKEFEEPQENC